MGEEANRSRAVRDKILAELRRELMGPSQPEEFIQEYPSTRYIVGRLAPAQSGDDDSHAQTEPLENDALGAGADDIEAGQDEQSPPLVVGFNPSSMGLSFLLDCSVEHLRVEISWGDYKREKHDDWKRYPRRGTVDGVPVATPGKIPCIPLTPAQAVAGVTVEGVDDPEIFLEGVVHDFSGYRAISLFLVNRRIKGSVEDSRKDEQWIYQPSLRVSHSSGQPVFVAKDSQAHSFVKDDDRELLINNLLYRHAREFATGHGVAAGWESAEVDNRRAAAVFTDFIPSHEVPQLIPPVEIAGGAVLDMKVLAEVATGGGLVAMLQPLVVKYNEWIERLERSASEPCISADAQLRGAAEFNIERCREAATRLQAGLCLLQTDQHVFEAFRFANRAMWDQRVHSIWAAANRKLGEVSGNPSNYDFPCNRTWRPFQIGFILINLVGVSDETSEDRRIVDLLWFPTGGGKTEAYLGLAALTLGLRRLRGDRHGMHGGAGVSIIMRYTLRLLTVQQFQRAAALIAACEVIRRSDPAHWGDEPFQIGLWVGRGTTPNTFAESQKALDDICTGKSVESSPIQLVSCPRCGALLVNDRGVPEPNTYVLDRVSLRTRIWCRSLGCAFSPAHSAQRGLPVVVVDDEIYRACPSLIVTTVDKFARMPFKGETCSLFGLRDRYSPTYGHLTGAHGDRLHYPDRVLRDVVPAPRLLPPELIIQDELHLISGPLGTMVGLYEAAVDYLSSIRLTGGARSRTKIIASTATIRRAQQQVRQLYARKLAIFPPAGLTARDSFFARELKVDAEDDSKAGRLFVGINAPGSSTKTLLVRVYAALLAAAQAEIEQSPEAADPFGTLVGYFNSLRALGGAKRLVEDDIQRVRLKYLARQRGLPRRYISTPEELTSRIDSWRIPGLLKRLDQPFPRGKTNWPVDVLLATNMISVGVDIDRLGLMVVTGQPKTTAEYIQATSRIGRKHPGLVITMYNWLGVRDLSHYESFHSYHAALYRYVEAIGVTPFSSRALERGLQGIFAAMNRLAGNSMSMETQAQNFEPTADLTVDVIEQIVDRVENIEGASTANLVKERLLLLRNEWAHLASNLLRYSWQDDKPPDNSRVLLRTAGTENEGEWSTPGSLREVEPTAAFFLDDLEV